MAASAALPILINLGKLLATYGPQILQLLIQIGVIKLPPGVTLPTLPAAPSENVASAHAAALAALGPVQAELNLAALAGHAGDLSRLYLDAQAGNLA